MAAVELVDISIAEEDAHVRRRREESQGREEWQMPIEAFTSMLKEDSSMDQLKWKQKDFYKHQNEIIRSLLKAQEEVRRGQNGLGATEAELDAQEALNLSRKIAIYGSVVCNVFLLILKVFAAYFSGSLSVIASALDSFLDLLSGAIIFVTEIMTLRTSQEDYPAGKSRFEPVGIVIFAACMFTATLQLLLSSIEALIAQDLHLMVDGWTLAVLLTTIGLKFVLWMYCRKVSGSEAVNALSVDHRNDVISNLFGVSTALLGYHYRWWIDPLGAVLISLYLMFIWARTGYCRWLPSSFWGFVRLLIDL